MQPGLWNCSPQPQSQPPTTLPLISLSSDLRRKQRGEVRAASAPRVLKTLEPSSLPRALTRYLRQRKRSLRKGLAFGHHRAALASLSASSSSRLGGEEPRPFFITHFNHMPQKRAATQFKPDLPDRVKKK